MRITKGCFAVTLFALAVAPAVAQNTGVDNYAPRTVIARPFRAITNPTIVPAEKTTIADNELVIGVELNGQSRAYPINQLTGPRREIINDVLGGTAIAATW